MAGVQVTTGVHSGSKSLLPTDAWSPSQSGVVYRELLRSTSGTDRALSSSVFASRSRDSSRTEFSSSVILAVVLETVAVESEGPLLEKMDMEAEVEVKAALVSV